MPPKIRAAPRLARSAGIVTKTHNTLCAAFVMFSHLGGALARRRPIARTAAAAAQRQSYTEYGKLG